MSHIQEHYAQQYRVQKDRIHLMSSLFTTQAPATPAADDDTPYELGMKFMVAKAGVISSGEPTIARGILSFRRSRL